MLFAYDNDEGRRPAHSIRPPGPRDLRDVMDSETNENPAPSAAQTIDTGQSFRIGIGQMAPTLGNLSANMQMHRERIDQASKQDVDLLIFPELSLTGYYLRDQVSEVAEPLDGPHLTALAQHAPDLAMIVGCVEETPETLFYNCAAYLENGRVQDCHRKLYLPTYGMFDELRYFAAGHRLRALPTRFGRIGVLICEDAWHLSSGVVLGADRIDLLVLVCNSPGRGVDDGQLGSRRVWEMLAGTYAMFLGVPVVFANRVGYEDGVCFWGGSLALDASGRVLARGPEFEDALVTAQIDTRVTRRQRIINPLHRDERHRLVLDELERIQREHVQNRPGNQSPSGG